MKLIFKQRAFSWFDSYDIYDEGGNTVFSVKGQFSWGHKLHIMDAFENHIATVKEETFSFRPRYALYEGADSYIGEISKKWSFFTPAFELDFRGWYIEGDFFEWEYTIFDCYNEAVAVISKELFNFTDTYVIDVVKESDALHTLMVVLAIDAEKCRR